MIVTIHQGCTHGTTHAPVAPKVVYPSLVVGQYMKKILNITKCTFPITLVFKQTFEAWKPLSEILGTLNILMLMKEL